MAVTVAVTVIDTETETVTVAVPSAPQETAPVLNGIPAPAVPVPEFVLVPTLLPPASGGVPGTPPLPALGDEPAPVGAPG